MGNIRPTFIITSVNLILPLAQTPGEIEVSRLCNQIGGSEKRTIVFDEANCKTMDPLNDIVCDRGWLY